MVFEFEQVFQQIGAAVKFHRRLEKNGRQVHYAFRGKMATLIQLYSLESAGLVHSKAAGKFLHRLEDRDVDVTQVAVQANVWTEEVEKKVFDEFLEDDDGTEVDTLWALPLSSMEDAQKHLYPFTVAIRPAEYFEYSLSYPVRLASRTPDAPTIALWTVPAADLFLDLVLEIIHKTPHSSHQDEPEISHQDCEIFCALALAQHDLQSQSYPPGVNAGRLGLDNQHWLRTIARRETPESYEKLRRLWHQGTEKGGRVSEVYAMLGAGPEGKKLFSKQDVEQAFDFVNGLLQVPYVNLTRLASARHQPRQEYVPQARARSPHQRSA
ncbi:hypothetical protein JCM10213_007783 [Rhodosporidiobolus nylandii]